jgi:hypothetical protein
VHAGKAEEFDREPFGLEFAVDALHALGDAIVRDAGTRHASEVAFDVGEKDGDAVARAAFGQELKGARLAGAGRARDESVAIHHAEGDADGEIGLRLSVFDDVADVDRGSGKIECRLEGRLEIHEALFCSTNEYDSPP